MGKMAQGLAKNSPKGYNCLPQIAIRQMLKEDDSLTMMLFFGFVGLLNAACLAPVLILLRIGGFVQTAGLTLRILGLTVCKGTISDGSYPHKFPKTLQSLHHCVVFLAKSIF